MMPKSEATGIARIDCFMRLAWRGSPGARRIPQEGASASAPRDWRTLPDGRTHALRGRCAASTTGQSRLAAGRRAGPGGQPRVRATPVSARTQRARLGRPRGRGGGERTTSLRALTSSFWSVFASRTRSRPCASVSSTATWTKPGGTSPRSTALRLHSSHSIRSIRRSPSRWAFAFQLEVSACPSSVHIDDALVVSWSGSGALGSRPSRSSSCWRKGCFSGRPERADDCELAVGGGGRYEWKYCPKVGGRREGEGRARES